MAAWPRRTAASQAISRPSGHGGWRTSPPTSGRSAAPPELMRSKTPKGTLMRRHRDVHVANFFLAEREGGQEFSQRRRGEPPVAAPHCDHLGGLRSQPIRRDRSQRHATRHPVECGSNRASGRHRTAAPAVAAVIGSDPGFPARSGNGG